MQKLGQHFLINKSAIKKIVAALDLEPNDNLIEIGAGKGALTFPLAVECQKINCRLIAIERDQKLAELLKVESERKKFELIQDDALKILPNLNANKIVGNIPYYITGKLLRILSDLENKPSLSIFMIQREVAERIAAKPPEMNLLAAAVQFWAEPKILFTLKPNDFSPQPKVNSAVIKLTANQEKPAIAFIENYYKLIRIIFKQPRKTLINNLRAGLNLPKNEIESALKSLKISPESRPQNLSLSQIKELTYLLSSN